MAWPTWAAGSIADRLVRISILTQGSRGDIQPYVGLGAALSAAGHLVTLAVSAAFAPMVLAAGLAVHLVAPDRRLRPAGNGPPRWLPTGLVGSVIQLVADGPPRNGRPSAYEGYQAACRRADVVLYPAWLAPVARTIARNRGLLAMPAFLAPFHPTRAFPSPFLPRLPGRAWNHASHSLALWLGSVILSGRPLLRNGQFRPRAFTAGACLPAHGETCLYGYSRTLLPPPPDWPAGPLVTGPWWLEPAAGWRPPPGLERFLQGPGKVIFLGFGSMMAARPAELTTIVKLALAGLDCRAAIAAGPPGQLVLEKSDRIFPVGDIPHSWLFPRVDAVVHHGGAGTTAEALRAGKPSVVIPFLGDQVFWGRRLAHLGAAPAPLPHGRLTSGGLVQAIQQALVEPELRRRAEELGACIREEQGLATAVQAIEALAR